MIYAALLSLSFIAIVSSIDTFIVIEMQVAAMVLYKWNFDYMDDC